MKSLRLILGSIAAAVIAADEQVVHLHGMNKAENQSSGALMGKPHRDVSSSLVATTSSLSMDFGRSPIHSRMYVALESKDAVSDTDERYEVARIPASQAPRARVLSARCSGQRAESRAA